MSFKNDIMVLKDYLINIKDNLNVSAVFCVKDTIGYWFTDDVQEAMQQLGIKSILKGKLMSGFIAIYDRGKVIYESDIQYNVPQKVNQNVGNHFVSVTSQPFKAGNKASISIDGVEYSVNIRGLNIVVFDTEKNSIIDSVGFDTHVFSVPCIRKMNLEYVYNDIKSDLLNIYTQINNLNKKISELSNEIKINKYHSELIQFGSQIQGDESVLDVKKRFFKKLNNHDDYELSLIQKTTSILLKEFGRICNKNDIQYWLAFGTLLGAVRHTSFVPWDDDADVGMMRTEIEKLKDVLEKTDTFIRLVEFFYFNGKEIFQIFRIKFKDNNINIFVDIFPYYYVKTTDYKKVWGIYREQRKKLRNTVLEISKNNNYWKNNLPANQDIIDILTIELANCNEQINVSEEPTDYIIWGLENFEYYKGKYGIHPTDNIFPLQEHLFNGDSYKIPNKFNEQLSAVYGDYYELPMDILGHNHIGRNSELIKEYEKLIEKYKS